jgi:hypothetical protein
VNNATAVPPKLEVVIEVPRGSFLKRGSTGHVDFVSPLPCPFNYGSVPKYLGLEGDLLDAVVLGPRLPLGARVRVEARGAVVFTDRGMSDDKLICSSKPLTSAQRRLVARTAGRVLISPILAHRLQESPCEYRSASAAGILTATPRKEDAQSLNISDSCDAGWLWWWLRRILERTDSGSSAGTGAAHAAAGHRNRGIGLDRPDPKRGRIGAN